MTKLTLKTAQTALGVGSLVEKTIRFRGADGGEFEGEVFIKILSHDEKVNAIDVWGLNEKHTATVDQLTKAIVFHSVYESEGKRFFPKVQDTGSVSTELLDAMYKAADAVLDFSGKYWISKQMTNSGVSSSSTESADEPLQKQEEI
ncbi:hypothetical protein CDG60_08710 [Acinetobacter chinensis]|uniref:Phage tail protein n=1 Tax=Acinetobacter chinensis TaxID=2004650 RepID=A0A3B7M220_9GAMM|nr:phage tail assembly chaperone family protein, TAC [Acinetobacter chinensis]AXY56643.1 hypothetical protein CDG60_08710 [Acinetobacter chinensis]